MLTPGKPVGLGDDSPFLPEGGQVLPLGDSNPVWGLQGEVAQDPHFQLGTHGCLTRHLIFLQFWHSQGAAGPAVLLATPCTPRAAHGGTGTACRGFETTAEGPDHNSPLAGFPGLPYGSRCPEFEPWAEPGVKSSGWLRHPSNVPAKQGSAARRNVIPTGPAGAQQLRSEPRGSCRTPRPASDSLSALLLPCRPRLPPPSWLEGRELWECALRGCGCAFSGRAGLRGGIAGSKGGAPAPHTEEAGSTPTRTPAPGDGGEPRLAAGCSTPYAWHRRRAKAGQGTLQSGGIGTGCGVIL